MEHFTKQEKCKPYFEGAYGYAVFEKVGKVGFFFVGGAMGDGKVCIKNAEGVYEKVGTSKVLQGSLGPQFGGQLYSMIIFFQTEDAYKKFTDTDFEFGADANVVALTASAAGKASTIDKNLRLSACVKPDDMKFEHSTNALPYSNGMAVFTSTTGGLMYEASLSGQKFSYKAAEKEETAAETK